eukprot:897511-Amphidinium_carterae.1
MVSKHMLDRMALQTCVLPDLETNMVIESPTTLTMSSRLTAPKKTHGSSPPQPKKTQSRPKQGPAKWKKDFAFAACFCAQHAYTII